MRVERSAAPRHSQRRVGERRVAGTFRGNCYSRRVTDDLSEKDRAPLALRPSGSVAVYAGLSGLAAAVPVPIVEGIVAGLARGAAMRRVAQRHGVRLTRGARAILAEPGLRARAGKTDARLLRSLLTRVLPPLRIASRAEDVVATALSAVVLDHYLARGGRAPGVLAEGEARRVRDAMDAAIVEGAFAALKDVPNGAVQTLKDALAATRTDDDEDRGLIERAADTLLDGLADAPEELLVRLFDAFDTALARATAAT
jgi:hypothetical protein